MLITTSKSLTIENVSSDDLSLRVRVEGEGISVTPEEEFLMLATEARTIQVEVSPIFTEAVPATMFLELPFNNEWQAFEVISLVGNWSEDHEEADYAVLK